MPLPLIAVTAPVEVLPTAFGEQDCTKLTSAYTSAIYAVGGRPVIMPVVVDPPDELLAGFDGLVLTGGGDLDPRLYGEEPDPTVYGVRPERDTFEIAVYREALERRLPILAICRGMQLVNVLRGGTLIQQIQSDVEHWQTTPAHESSHKIESVAHSALAEALGRTTAGVNSYHHQGLNRLGEGLRVTATCGDVIEAVEATTADLIGVQWHPEQMAATDDLQSALFEAFVRKAAARPHQPQNLRRTHV